MRPVVTDVPCSGCAFLYVCGTYDTMHIAMNRAKPAEPIEMPSGMCGLWWTQGTMLGSSGEGVI